MPKITGYSSRVVINSTSDQGSNNWKGDYYRFAGMSYAQVLKNGVNRRQTLVNNSTRKVGCVSAEKHAVNTPPCTSNVNKAGINVTTVKYQSKHDPIVRVNNQVSGFHDHIIHSEKQYDSHVDGMVFSRFFTANKFSLLENDKITYHNDINVPHVDGSCQNNAVKPTCNTPVTKVSVHSNLTKENSVADTVVSPLLGNRYETVTATRKKEAGTVNSSADDKFELSLISRPQNRTRINNAKNTDIFRLWDSQNHQKFRFIPLSDLALPSVDKRIPLHGSLLQARYDVSKEGNYNFMGAQIQIPSQLNPDVWQDYLIDYWDKQLPYLIRYGFPLDFDTGVDLNHTEVNHPSAKHYVPDVKAYLEEEVKYKAVLGPFRESPYPDLHISPFMNRDKPGAKNRRVIIDLSYPQNHSVNAGVHKDQYLGTQFALTLPSLDNITDEMKKLGKGSLIYKVDISRAFRHVKIDPKDYYLLGLKLDHYYLDTCLPFGFRHGSSIFQRLSDAIRFIMTSKGHSITNYIDDLIGHALPSQAHESFNTLTSLLQELGLQISSKKLISPTTRAVCLGIEVDTVNFTLAIPQEKLNEIGSTCDLWATKDTCSKRDLQSLLGQLLYISKCVRASKAFLNCMLDLLRASDKQNLIHLTVPFKQDLNWFRSFLPTFNGTTFFCHKKFDLQVHLDACLNGLGAICGNEVYAIPLTPGFCNYDIVHLEMINILVAIRAWAGRWANHKILIHCDNQAVVAIMASSKTRDLTLAAIHRNILMECAKFDIELNTVHIAGKSNVVADALSRLSLDSRYMQSIYSYVADPVWLSLPTSIIELNWSI